MAPAELPNGAGVTSALEAANPGLNIRLNEVGAAEQDA